MLRGNPSRRAFDFPRVLSGRCFECLWKPRENSSFRGCDYCLKAVTLFVVINNLNPRIKTNLVQLELPTIK